MRTQRLTALSEIDAVQWNALVRNNNPFLRYEFLNALERHACVGESAGWLPWHIVCFDDDNRLVAATPLYLKDNSYGEFVFDLSMAMHTTLKCAIITRTRRYNNEHRQQGHAAVPHAPGRDVARRVSEAARSDADGGGG
ncbi:MAG: hypothetical protein HC808_13140, partial [Candidatus Competibacteraceae bacterium]|nr:hypothetical protein [Candidatus Competibacteraceae bacterium]